jgi:hypothetical protein
MVDIEVLISLDPYAIMTAAGVPDGVWWFVTGSTVYTCSVPGEYAAAVLAELEKA